MITGWKHCIAGTSLYGWCAGKWKRGATFVILLQFSSPFFSQTVWSAAAYRYSMNPPEHLKSNRFLAVLYLILRLFSRQCITVFRERLLPITANTVFDSHHRSQKITCPISMVVDRSNFWRLWAVPQRQLPFCCTIGNKDLPSHAISLMMNGYDTWFQSRLKPISRPGSCVGPRNFTAYN
jgi:hypothetical protein